MERGYYIDEFDELIKQKADQYKMYPSDQVWKGINRSLHTRKNGTGLVSSFLFPVSVITPSFNCSLHHLIIKTFCQ